MFSLDGFQVDFTTYSKVLALREQGHKVALTAGHFGQCENCRDYSGHLLLHQVVAEYDVWHPNCVEMKSTGKWGELKTVAQPCPVCNERKSQALSYAVFKQSGLRHSELEWTVDHYGDDPGKAKAVALVRAIIKKLPSAKGFHTLFGDYGMGKSGLAKCAMAHQVRIGAAGAYRVAADILAEVKDTYSNSSASSEMEVVERYKKFPLLVVDEFDRSSSTEWAMSVLFTLLDARYNARGELCTIVITNQDPRDLPTAYAYLADRMKDGYRLMVGGAKLRGERDEPQVGPPGPPPPPVVAEGSRDV